MEDTIYDHYIAIDWAIKNMAIARMTKKSNKITAIDVPSDIDELAGIFKKPKGNQNINDRRNNHFSMAIYRVKEICGQDFDL